MSIPARTVSLAKGGDGAFRFWDPSGAAFNSTKISSTVAPVVACTTPQFTTPPLGSPVYITFSSTQPGAWEVASGPDDAICIPNIDGLSCTISFVPSLVRAPMAFYVSARCKNKGGASVATNLIGPGMRGVLTVGVGAGWEYATLQAAVTAAGGLGGYVFALQNQTVNGMLFSRFGLQPPPGDYTTNTSGPDPVYTISRYTTVAAAEPFGVLLDGQGTAAYGIDLYGSTSLESTELALWSGANYPITGQHVRGVQLMGFVGQRHTEENISITHCDHILTQYCIGLGAATESQPLRAARSTDIAFEYCWGTGPGRYKIGFYQCKRTLMRRCFGQEQQITDGTPRGRFVEYHLQDHVTQNLIEWDNDQTDFWTLSSWQDSGMLTLAHTDFYGYGTNWRHDRCLSYNSKMGMLLNDQRTLPNETSYIFRDMAAWRMRPYGAGAIGQNGPSRFWRATAAYIDNSNGGYANFIWEPNRHVVNDSIIYKYGYTAAGAPTNTGYLIYSYDINQPVDYNNVTIYDVGAGVTERQGLNTGTSVTFTNVDKLTDPRTQGMRYPYRIEPGSNYDLIARGANNIHHALGVLGTLYGETGYTDDSSLNWMARSLFDLALPFFRAYSYTGPRVSGGTGTLSGNRGGNMSDKLLLDYICSDGGRDVPFPRSIEATKNGGVLQVSWQLFASAYQGTIAGWKIFIDGAHSETCPPDTHAALFAGLIAGRIYTIKIVAADSVHGDSGFSDSITVVM